MNVLILEDEQEAVHRLTGFLERYGREENAKIRIIGAMESVWETVAYFQGLQERRAETALSERVSVDRSDALIPDVLFVDIHLADGLSFEIFRHVDIRVPIIFTTAYDKYALRAFDVHSVAYLLKPFGYDDVLTAIRKLATHKTLFGAPEGTAENEALRDFQTALREISAALAEGQKERRYKTRFLLNAGGGGMTIVRVEDVAYFHADGKIVSIVEKSGRRHIADNTLDELEGLLNPDEFFRVSRKCLLRVEAVADMEPYFNGRLALRLQPPFQGETLVSRERVRDFKAWLEWGGAQQ